MSSGLSHQARELLLATARAMPPVMIVREHTLSIDILINGREPIHEARPEGNRWLSAIEALVLRGCLLRHGERYDLTDEGRSIAAELQNP
jgi:hypothetical protein